MHSLVDRGPPTPLASLYVHVPFCRDRCSYCAFATVPDAPADHERLVLGLCREADRQVLPDTWHTVYLGGGTPALLEPPLLGRLLSHLGADPAQHPRPAEVTLEANPANVTREALGAWWSLGITRLSLGVQTFDDPALRRLGRRHDAAASRRALALLAEHWPGTWSADLLIGWEGQRRAGLLADLAALTDHDPPHVAVYPLELEPASTLAKRLQREPEVPLSYSHLYITGRMARETLGAAGLQRYEVSNYARPGHESRHNQAYWQNMEYLGLGPGACSSRGPHRWTNHRDTTRWLAAVEAGRSPRGGAERLTPAQRLLESLAVGLRTSTGVELDALEARFGPGWRALAESAAGGPLESLGLVTRGGHLLAPGAERLRVDAILAELARRWPDPGQATP